MMYHSQGKVSPLLFLEEMNDSNSPPSYTEAVNLPIPTRSSMPAAERKEELRPKLCKLEKTSDGFGFHLNSIQGVCGHYLQNVRLKNNVHNLTIDTLSTTDK